MKEYCLIISFFTQGVKSSMDGFINVFLHLDQFLGPIVKEYGAWTYILLFLIIFFETGLIVFPFLPGDSLLFTAGTFAGIGYFNVNFLVGTLVVAAILGNTLNYALGYWVGPRVFDREDSRFFKKAYLDEAHLFYDRHGGTAIVLARFVPVLRSFAPFVAGIAKMDYGRFTLFNIVGAILWISVLIYLSYFFGNIPFVRQNFSVVILSIVAISAIPMILGYLQHRFKKS